MDQRRQAQHLPCSHGDCLGPAVALRWDQSHQQEVLAVADVEHQPSESAQIGDQIGDVCVVDNKAGDAPHRHEMALCQEQSKGPAKETPVTNAKGRISVDVELGRGKQDEEDDREALVQVVPHRGGILYALPVGEWRIDGYQREEGSPRHEHERPLHLAPESAAVLKFPLRVEAVKFALEVHLDLGDSNDLVAMELDALGQRLCAIRARHQIFDCHLRLQRANAARHLQLVRNGKVTD
eukprot:6751354-Prymnesium_polylepis.2